MRQLKISKSITNRESQSLEKYLQEIAKVELITPEEEAQLAVSSKSGNQQALDRLVKANLRFVVSVAKQYQNQGLTLPDLINEGNLGLIKAAIRFDETKGFKFISYAVWWIRQSILQALAEQSRIVRLPLNKVGLSNRINKAFQQLEQQYEREPSAEELALVLETDLQEVAATISVNTRHISIDTPLSEGDDTTLIDVMINDNAERADEKLAHHESLKQEVQRSMLSLTQKQREVLCYFFGIGTDNALSLEDIGARFNLTRERVRQIKDNAINKLRSTSRCRQLRVYLG
ncbi:MAG: RNA polymerase sigma factor RpoD/SigA [Bacteroidetes bacterium]|nr:RNA polymerase sigma factor RpoD/SigA [Bacteroidota bacterium]MBS1591677.1 RNA polymerase sigma factor RpoD/SigA [Bacteroidota bacterium]